MTSTPVSLPSDLASAHAVLLAERAARLQVEARLVSTEALIVELQLLIDQLELQLEELVTSAAEDEWGDEEAAVKTQAVRAFTRKRPARQPWPEDIERERIVIEAPATCVCCGSSRLSKLGEDITRTLEERPRRFKLIETVREKFICRDCEAISQPPAPFHATLRGFLGPNLLATIVFDKFGQHIPLNQQSTRFRCEGIALSTQTLADQVGHVTFSLKPLFDLIEGYVFEAERLHGDDTTIPILAKGKCTTGRIWVYVRDDQPFAGPAPPAAVFYASSDRRGEHSQRHLADFSGILQADCYSGFNPLFDRTRKQMPATPAFCFAHARRKFFELADVARNARRGKGAKPISPLALEAVTRIDALFAIEREINSLSATERLTVRQERVKPLLAGMEEWLRTERVSLSRSSPVREPIDYVLTRWVDFARYADDGRICMTNNAAERALRGVACGRKSWLFAGSDRGADRAAVMLTLIITARLNDVDPKAWLADVLARIATLPLSRLHELLPWEWKRLRQTESPTLMLAA
ncbi:IS66 family transposase [Stappia sp. P2PMeth1]|uniref:IS66 family transposase n=1 Tax=Stappia sp. P2PMeth1 TaxID=2003586 RepID=UPI0016480D94|nr:IS66 family transposase [Stappia sp. P2PMeth1]